jgi:hypothetical protein
VKISPSQSSVTLLPLARADSLHAAATLMAVDYDNDQRPAKKIGAFAVARAPLAKENGIIRMLG